MRKLLKDSARKAMYAKGKRPLCLPKEAIQKSEKHKWDKNDKTTCSKCERTRNKFRSGRGKITYTAPFPCWNPNLTRH